MFKRPRQFAVGILLAASMLAASPSLGATGDDIGMAAIRDLKRVGLVVYIASNTLGGNETAELAKQYNAEFAKRLGQAGIQVVDLDTVNSAGNIGVLFVTMDIHRNGPVMYGGGDLGLLERVTLGNRNDQSVTANTYFSNVVGTDPASEGGASFVRNVFEQCWSRFQADLANSRGGK